MKAKYWLLVALIVALGLLAWAYRTPPASLPDASFGGVSLTLEYATTTADQERGLGGRTSLAPNHGMLFVFTHDDYYGFWMKDTLIPLDMFWLGDQGQVVYIVKDVATSTYPNVLYPTAPARSVLELNAGFANSHNITIGTELKLRNPSIVSE